MHAPIAELVKLRPFKARIQGSNPCGSTYSNYAPFVYRSVLETGNYLRLLIE